MVLTHGFITKNTQVYVCVCVRERVRPGCGAYS